MNLITFKWIFAAILFIVFTGCAQHRYIEEPTYSTFNWFEYEGNDVIFDTELADNLYQNPILAGFYPDPSIVAVGEDFYLIHSSFSFFPGIPIFHSTDLVNWRPLGHVLTRKSQLDLDGAGVSRGIFAPTIRYHNGLFYVITTVVDTGGNFIVTAKDPAGPWSEPTWLPEIGGIDPDLFFDDDGRVYIAHNDAPEGEPLYEGHRAIWLWEFDLPTMKVVKGSGRVIVNGGVDISKQPVWAEGPHIYKKDGWYYLTTAEGGTSYEHSQVIYRTKSLANPFVPYQGNPILTQRDLDPLRANPVNAAGHADFVKTSNGEWWAVFLAVRNYNERHFNTGRETFLLPVEWKDGWPHILPQGQAIPLRQEKPSGLPKTPDAEVLTGNFVWRDEFAQGELSPRWNLLRNTSQQWLFWQPDDSVSLIPIAVSLKDSVQPAALFYRQQHIEFEAKTELSMPIPIRTSAGVIAFQNEQYHYYFGVKNTGRSRQLFLEKASGGEAEVVKLQSYTGQHEKLQLGIEGKAGDIHFYYLDELGDKVYFATEDATILSTEVARGFVGAHVGIHVRKEH